MLGMYLSGRGFALHQALSAGLTKGGGAKASFQGELS